MMDKGAEYYCPPEIIDALFEDFPLNERDHSDAEIRGKFSVTKEVKLENEFRTNSMDFKCSISSFSENGQSMQSFLSDEMETDVSEDHQLYYKQTNLFTKQPTTYQSNDPVITNKSIQHMSDITKNILNKYIHVVPLHAENNSYFITLTSETIENQNNIKLFEFYHKRNTGKLVAGQMNKILLPKSTSTEKHEENRHKYSTFMPNKCKETNRLTVKRITWKDPCYSCKTYELIYDPFINTNSFLSLMAEGSPVVVMESINDSTGTLACGKLKLTSDMPFLSLGGHLSVISYNKNIKYENTLEHKLAKFQLRDKHSFKTDTYIMTKDSDTQKYQICSKKNDLSISKIKIQQKGGKCMKCSHQKGSKGFETTVEHKPEKCLCFNQTKPMKVKLKYVDKISTMLPFLPSPNLFSGNSTVFGCSLDIILQIFGNNFQSSKINFCNEINMINTTNSSNFSHHRNNSHKEVVDICNSNYHQLFASMQGMSPCAEYIQLEHDLYSSSSDCQIISSPIDSEDKFSKIPPVQQNFCGITSTEVDHDLMNLIDKEVDLSCKQHEKKSLQLADKSSPKEVECQTDLSLNCSKIYKYQHSDSYNTFNISNTYQLPGLYYKRENLEVSGHNATPAKRRCSSDVSVYQEEDMIKWKIERYLSSNADETNQIVPGSGFDEEKYEFNSMELYNEVEAMKEKKDISAYKMCTYKSNEIKSVTSTNENTSSHKNLNYMGNRRSLRLGLSKRANTKRLHSHVLGHN